MVWAAPFYWSVRMLNIRDKDIRDLDDEELLRVSFLVRHECARRIKRVEAFKQAATGQLASYEAHPDTDYER